MKHSHICSECGEIFDCEEEELSSAECEPEALPICEDCR